MTRRELNKYLKLPLPELIAAANRARRRDAGAKIELCSILNAKSGLCAQDCKFCAQSSRHKTGAAVYPLKNKAEILKAARRAKSIGAQRFDIVTSGNRLSKKELDLVAASIREITTGIGLPMCASLGSMDQEGFRLLKEAGLSRYHHNIETSRRYFPRVATTHSFDDRLKTIRAAKRCGLEVCSGGIIGMGETIEDRLDMAWQLKELGVDSVPLNFLVPVKGTAFERRPSLSAAEAIRTIALFRLILGGKIIKVAAGRESVLAGSQSLAFMAGANGMLIGGYLTIKGRKVSDDHRLVEEVRQLWKQ